MTGWRWPLEAIQESRVRQKANVAFGSYPALDRHVGKQALASRR